MLKIYDSIYSVSINGGQFKQVSGFFDTDWFVGDEDLPETEVLLDNVSFIEAYEWLKNHYVSGARPCTTIFKGRPQISLRYRYSMYDSVGITEKKCKKFSILIERKLRAGVTIEWISRNLPANQAIQYFIERGISISLTQKKTMK